MSASDYLVIDRLEKRFDDVVVLTDFSLRVARGEILALLGPSGSGKTTALRLLAGFEQPDSGSILIAGDDVTRVPPAQRRCGMVFQHYALFPHMTVAENVAFGLSGQPPETIRRRTEELLAQVDLAGLGERPAAALSGGQQQRVALARALAPRPRVLLLDEPLSNLDPSLRERTRRELGAAVRATGITTVLVTHEQEEAFELGDRIALLGDGRLVQVGTARELYERPASRFVAGFVGRASFLPGRLESSPAENSPDGAVARLADGTRWPVDLIEALPDAAPLDIALRPEGVRMVAPSSEAAAGEVMEKRYAGAITYFRVRLTGGGEVEVAADRDAAQVGESVDLAPRASKPRPRAFARKNR